MWIRKRILEILNQLDTDIKIYLSVLIISWTAIIFYLVSITEDEKIMKSIESYPYEHSQITDSTLKQK